MKILVLPNSAEGQPWCVLTEPDGLRFCRVGGGPRLQISWRDVRRLMDFAADEGAENYKGLRP